MASTTHSQDALSILLIEDSKVDAVLIEKELNAVFPENYILQKAVTLEQAINLLPQYDFNVALLDRSLPDANEFDGLFSLQNMAPELPIVFLTSFKNEQTALNAIEQGAQDYLLKDKSNGRVIKHAIQFAILRKKFECNLIERANFDLLTGLANRWLFEDRLDMAIAKMKRHKTTFALFFLDLDLFKSINDTYGHIAGDNVLKEVALRLKKSFRSYDTPARFGGDEFAVLLDCMSEITDAERVAKKIITLFEKPIQVFGNELNIDVSIGIVTCDAQPNAVAETLIKKADEAMYKAKSEKGSNYYLWDGEIE